MMKADSDIRIAEKIAQLSELRGKRVLEIGCGKGRITSFLVGRPAMLIGIDPDIDSIREAREKVADVDFREGSGERLAFSDAHFDNSVAAAMSDFLGAKRDNRPIVLEDVMTIQALKNHRSSCGSVNGPAVSLPRL